MIAEIKKVGPTGSISKIGPVLSSNIVKLILQKRSSNYSMNPIPPAIAK